MWGKHSVHVASLLCLGRNKRLFESLVQTKSNLNKKWLSLQRKTKWAAPIVAYQEQQDAEPLKYEWQLLSWWKHFSLAVETAFCTMYREVCISWTLMLVRSCISRNWVSGTLGTAFPAEALWAVGFPVGYSASIWGFIYFNENICYKVIMPNYLVP